VAAVYFGPDRLGGNPSTYYEPDHTLDITSSCPNPRPPICPMWTVWDQTGMIWRISWGGLALSRS
jgi:hypothetical protein